MLAVDPVSPSQEAIDRAVAVLRRGGLLAFPTDTLYALGADASSIRAVHRTFAAKGRPFAKPIPLLVADMEAAIRVAGDLPELARRLADRYWPGPLTLLLSPPPGLPALLAAGSGRLGLRIPAGRIARTILARFGRPVTGTSANRSGGGDPRNAEEVRRQLGRRIDLILDGGPVPLGMPSTVVDVAVDPPLVVREGAIPRQEILALLAVPPGARAPENRDRSGPKHIGKPPNDMIILC